MSNEYGKFTVSARDKRGKGSARRLRSTGQIPGVIYGRGGENVAISLDPRALLRAMDPERRYNTLFQVTIENEAAQAVAETCIIADVDVDPIRDRLRHVDFLRVDPAGEVERRIPVKYIGRAAGVAVGGRLETLLREVRVRAPAGAMPVSLVVDVTPLEVGQSLRVEDVPLPGGTVLERKRQVLAHVETAAKAKAEGAAAEAPGGG